MIDYAKLYEELRQAIDGGSESMTHKNALEAVRYWQDQPTPQQEFIATATHSQTHGRIEFTGTEALTELLGRFGSGRLVYLYADSPQKADAEQMYKRGWINAARWADRDDLIADIDSDAYKTEIDAAIQGARK